MGMWSKLALLAAGAVAGSVATRVARRPEIQPAAGTQLQRRRGAHVELRSGTAVARVQGLAQSFRDFAARVRAGMDEREAQLREQFGVRSPVDHTANHPGAHPGQHGVGEGHTVESIETRYPFPSAEGKNR